MYLTAQSLLEMYRMHQFVNRIVWRTLAYSISPPKHGKPPMDLAIPGTVSQNKSLELLAIQNVLDMVFKWNRSTLVSDHSQTDGGEFGPFLISVIRKRSRSENNSCMQHWAHTKENLKFSHINIIRLLFSDRRFIILMCGTEVGLLQCFMSWSVTVHYHSLLSGPYTQTQWAGCQCQQLQMSWQKRHSPPSEIRISVTWVS